MKRITLAWVLGLSMFTACKGKGSGDPQFTVDTVQLKHNDSLAEAQRRSDSILLHTAAGTPGINAGMNKFAVGTPAGWRRTDTLLGNIRALMLDTASTIHDFRTNISIVGDSMRGLTADGYLNGTIASLTRYVPRFSLIGKGERPIAGRAARWIHYAQDRNGTGIENICYIIPDGGIAYIVTCSALKGRLVQNYPAFEKTIRSFTLH
jgi:hypothetical protein